MISNTVPAGTQIRLIPGESIFIQQYLYHDFEVEPGTGPVLLGELSRCNDDAGVFDPNRQKEFLEVAKRIRNSYNAYIR